MAAERDFELLDDFLANRMPASERAAFENTINGDPELQREVRLQQQLIESLKKARVAELKSMLNNVPVPAASSTSTVAVKVAASVVITAVVGTGLYFLMSDKEVEPQPVAQEVIQPSEPAPAPKDAEPAAQQPIAIEEEETKKTAPAAVKKKKSEPAKTPVIDPKINVFDPTADLNDESSEPTEDEILSEDDKISTEEATIFVELDTTSRRHHFHYSLEKDNLKLYGPFEENLYEILEFFGENKRTAFLYYKKAYYYLKETDKITELTAVKDPVLLNKLRQHRTKNQ